MMPTTGASMSRSGIIGWLSRIDDDSEKGSDPWNRDAACLHAGAAFGFIQRLRHTT
ncbi:MAG: hypothetical protein ACU841_07540 [Gammaproteobacteria bacterium]